MHTYRYAGIIVLPYGQLVADAPPLHTHTAPGGLVRRMTVRHAFGTEVVQWDASDPSKIIESRCQKGGSKQAMPEFVLLVGDKEVEQAHFEDQMRCLADSLRAVGCTVHTGIVSGKSHATMIRHLGGGRQAVTKREASARRPRLTAALWIPAMPITHLLLVALALGAGAGGGHNLSTLYG